MASLLAKAKNLKKSTLQNSKSDSRENLQNVYETDEIQLDNAFAVHLAAKEGDLQTLQRLLPSLNKKEINKFDQNKKTALHYAVLSGNLQCVSVLLDFGADINLQSLYKPHGSGMNYHDYTPLHFACKAGNKEVFELLIERGAKLEIEDFQRQTALHIAIKMNNCHLAVYLYIEIESRKKPNKRNSELDLSGLKIDNRVNELSQLSKLNYLSNIDLSKNKFQRIPTEHLILLPSLQSLNLSDNQITEITPLCSSLKSLTFLDISNNLLDPPPLPLLTIPKLQRIKAKGNPFKYVPSNIAKAADSALLPYLEQLKNGSVSWKSLKLLVVGEENVGKTTLLRSLRSLNPSSSSSSSTPSSSVTSSSSSSAVTTTTAILSSAQSSLDTNVNISTNGIDIQEIQLDDGVELNAWDFGGQEVFYPTHQFFLTSRSIYLVVFNIANPKAYNKLEYWISQVQLVSNTSKSYIIIVGSHLDDPTCTEEYLQAKLTYLSDLQEKHPSIRSVHLISCKDSAAVTQLREKLSEVAHLHPFLDKQVPATWYVLDSKIKFLRESKKVQSVIEWKNCLKMAKSCEVEEGVLMEALEFLRDVGSLVFFRNRNTEPHPDFIIIDPSWLANVMSCLITFNHSWIKNGFLDHKDLGRIWEGYASTKHEIFLNLLEKFEILYRMRIIPSTLASSLQTSKSLPTISSSSSPQHIDRSISNRSQSAIGRSGPYELPATTDSIGRSNTTDAYLTPPPHTSPSRSPRIKPPISNPSTLSHSSPIPKSHPSPHHHTHTHTPSINNNNDNNNSNNDNHPPVGDYDHQSQMGGGGGGGGGEWSLLPSLLPEEQPPQMKVYWPSFIQRSEVVLGRIFQFAFLPLALFARVLSRLLHINEISILCVWRKGVIFQKEAQTAYITFDERQFILSAYIRAPRHTKCGNFLRDIVDNIETPIDAMYNFRSDQKLILVPCSHCITGGGGGGNNNGGGGGGGGDILSAYQFSIYECIQALTTGKSTVRCKKGDVDVLIESIAPDLTFGDLKMLEGVTIDKMLAKGGFGTVYKGYYDGSVVAIKELTPKGEDKEESNMEEDADKFNEFLREVYLMSFLDHPNLVKLYGITLNPMRMIMEFLSCGDLYHFIHSKTANYSYILQLKIALDMAKGMLYLQSTSPPIIHRDLRSPNILLVSVDEKADVVAKVADFGLARKLAPNIAGILATWQWLAPEVLDYENQYYDERSDVYSFGIVLYEIFTRNIPFDEYHNNPLYAKYVGVDENGEEIWLLRNLEIKNAIISQNLRPTLPPSLSPRIRELISLCWHFDKFKRPKFDHSVRILSDELKSALHSSAPPIIVNISSSNISSSNNSNNNNQRNNSNNDVRGRGGNSLGGSRGSPRNAFLSNNHRNQ